MKDNLPEIETLPPATQNISAKKKEFANDLIKGLNKQPKELSSKYFYDGTGSRLFQQIMELPEYYLTRTETQIFIQQRKEIIYSFLQDKAPFSLIDLGAGDAAKTKILLQELLTQHVSFQYLPVDISADALAALASTLTQEMPDLNFKLIVSEYFAALDKLHKNQSERKVLLFLGSNIGNFENKAILQFAKKLRRFLNPGDQILMGFDLRKEPHLIRQAYDDAAGITAAFNYNLLHRINQEFGANFQIEHFKHFAEYNPVTGDMKSYLISMLPQSIYISYLKQEFTFEAWEPIHTETSHKFTLKEIAALGHHADLKINEVFTDPKHYFADVLFDVV